MNERVLVDADPTGLSDLRIRLEDELTRRWSATAHEVKRAILMHDGLGIGDKAPRLAQPTADKATMFKRWLDERLMTGVIGYDASWLAPYVRRASGRAVDMQRPIGDAQQGLGFLVPGAAPSAKICHAATVSSLASICEDASDRAHADVAAGLLSQARPAQIARLVDQALGHGLKRTRMLAEHSLTQAFSQATLDALEAKGVTHVGTVSEHALKRVRDALPLAAGIMFVDPDGAALFLHRTDGQGWDFPGGGVVEPETLANGAVREAQEEAGGAPMGRLVKIWRSIAHGADFTTFRQEVAERFEPSLNYEHDDWIWAPLDDPPSPLHPGVEETLSGRKSRAQDAVESGAWPQGASIPLDLAAAVADFDPDEPRDEQGKWTSGGSVTPSLVHAGGEEFVSPSVAAHLSFDEAHAALSGARQQTMLKISDEIDGALGLKESAHSVIGAWSDGAENSVLTTLPDASWDEIKLSAAMKGYVGDQKAVLAFKQDDAGDALLYQMHAAGDLAGIHQRLLADGLAFHSLAPTNDGADVYVADLDGSAHDGIKRAVEDFGGQVTYQRGRAEFLGTSQETGSDREIRDDARRAYEGVIEQSPLSRGAEVWRRNRDRWSSALAQVRDAWLPWLVDAGPEDEPRDPRGRWTSQTTSPEFKAWFGASKGVDEAGRPKVFYHGSARDFSEFDLGQAGEGAGGMSEKAVFLSPNAAVASHYAEVQGAGYGEDPKTTSEGQVYPVFLSYKNPFVSKLKWYNSEQVAGEIRKARKGGHDAIEFSNFESQFETDTVAVFDPRQIKSAIGNRGTFDPTSPRITDAWLADAARKTPQPKHPRSGQFAKAHVVARETRRSKRTGQFRRQGLTLPEQRLEELREARFGRVKGRLDVLTAGDDRVCDVCDGISANGPYTINKARSLIPAHPNCRCLFVARGSMALDFDPNEPRDPHGRWTALQGSQGHYALVSTAPITATGRAGSAGAATLAAAKQRYTRIDMALLDKDPDAKAKMVALFRDPAMFPMVRANEWTGDTDKDARLIIERMKSNLNAVWGDIKPEEVAAWRGWYEGAHNLVGDRMGQYKKFGIDRPSMTAMYAAQSPNTEWDVNVHLGDRLLDTVFNHNTHKFDAEMRTAAGEQIANTVKGIADKEKKTGKTATGARQNLADMRKLFGEIDGKTLKELTDVTDQAAWIKLYNDAHDVEPLRQVNVDGSFGDIRRKKPTPAMIKRGEQGDPMTGAFGTLDRIANAITALRSKGDGNVISEAVGDKHKVRSFYNNMLDPNSANDDVTIDTHAGGAAWMFPFGGKDTQVQQMLGGSVTGGKAPPSSAVTGIKGTYPFYADAYREFAHGTGVLNHGREAQSVLWMKKIQLFRNISDANKALAWKAWNDYHDGKRSLAETQAEVLRIAKS